MTIQESPITQPLSTPAQAPTPIKEGRLYHPSKSYKITAQTENRVQTIPPNKTTSVTASFLAGKAQEAKQALESARTTRASNKPVYGPVNKSKETRDLETVITALSTDRESVSFSTSYKIGVGSRYIVTVRGEEYELEELLKKADLSHITFEKKEDFQAFLTSYEALSETFFNAKPVWEDEKGDLHPITEEYLNERINNQKFPINKEERKALLNLSFSEKLAIFGYTGALYSPINMFIRGDFFNAITIIEQRISLGTVKQ